MPFEKFRFAHASNVRLDGVLRDLGPVPEAVGRTLRDATLTAFENVVTTCLEQEVAFLLLAGNTFDAADTSLRARAALRDGLECLDEAGIRTVVVPGAEDQLDFWSRFGPVPDSVTVLGLDGSVASIARGDELLATITDGASARGLAGRNRLDGAHGRNAVYRLLAATAHDDFDPEHHAAHAEYVALVGEGARGTISSAHPLVHHAGHVESRSAADAGLGGLTLVDVASDGAARTTFVPTGLLRRERCNIEFEPDESPDRAAEKLARCLKDGDSRHRNVWLVDWHVHAGHGWLLPRREDLELRFELHWEEVGEGTVVHRWTNAETIAVADEDALHGELLNQVRRHAHADVAELLHRVAATTERTPATAALIRRLGHDVHGDQIVERAETRATDWLRRAIEGGHAA